MSIVSRILNERPDAFYVLSGASPWVDVSRRRLSNLSPTATRVPVSPARGLTESLSVAAATTVTLHKTPEEFTLMTQTKPRTTSATNLLSFYAETNEGLWQTGKNVTFGVKHMDNSYTYVTAEVDPTKMHILTGVAAKDKITLYVDGSPVAQSEIYSDSPYNFDNTITWGSTNTALYSFIAAWRRPLAGSAVAEISQAAKPLSLRTQTLGTYTISDLRVDNSSADLETFQFNDSVPALVDNVVVSGTRISAAHKTNQYTSPSTLAGSVKFPLPFTDTTGGIRLAWGDINGATVKYSLDGTNWVAATNGTTIGSGSTIATQPLIEVSFPADSYDSLYLSDFIAERQVTNAILPTLGNGRPVSLLGSVSLASRPDFREYPSSPSTFGTDGRIFIDPDTEDPSILTYGIEFWYTPWVGDLSGVKTLLNSNPDHASNITLNAGPITFNGFSALYINKNSVGSGTYTPLSDVPIHIVALYTTPNNAKITLGATSNPVAGNISHISIIRQSINASDVTNINNWQQAAPVTRPTSNTSVAAVDTAVSNLGLVWTTGAQ